MTPQKTLTILRHAKTELGAPAQDDHERTLTQRGIDAALAIGMHLAGKGMRPQKVLCSTAMRAQQTWKHVASFLAPVVPPDDYVEFTGKLYLASPNEMLGLLAQLPESLTHVMIVGHNPGLHQLCTKLAAKGDDGLLDNITLKFPTCACATLVFDTEWKHLAHAQGTLTDYVTPHALAVAEDE